MTLAPARMLPSSAVELRNDDGEPVAIIYARRDGLEIVCEAGHSAEPTIELTDPTHIGITISPE